MGEPMTGEFGNARGEARTNGDGFASSCDLKDLSVKSKNFETPGDKPNVASEGEGGVKSKTSRSRAPLRKAEMMRTALPLLTDRPMLLFGSNGSTMFKLLIKNGRPLAR